MLIANRTAAWQNAKPYKRRVEYIESSGTQYVDLSNAINGRTISATIKWCPMSATQDRWIFGGGQHSNPRYTRMGVYQSGPLFTLPNGTTCKIQTQRDMDSATSTVSEMVNGKYVVSTCGPFSSNYIYIFCQEWNYGPTGKLSARMFYCQIYSNDVVIASIIPVVDNNDVACMYDEVTGAFFYNAGTGSFTAGPVVGGGINANA